MNYKDVLFDCFYVSISHSQKLKWLKSVLDYYNLIELNTTTPLSDLNSVYSF